MVIRTILLVAVAASAAKMIAPAIRETNSAAQVRRGIAQYEKQQPDQAIREFDEAAKLRPSPLTSFNLGTAHIAAGHFTEGAELLGKAVDDPALRADAYYNRGNSALSANALDHAIRDYVSALKARPSDKEAKRNLEIALLRRQRSSQRPQPQQDSQNVPEQERKDEQDDPRRQDRAGEQKEQTDPEALLRSVEQQEREELSRMRRARAEPRRIGW